MQLLTLVPKALCNDSGWLPTNLENPENCGYSWEWRKVNIGWGQENGKELAEQQGMRCDTEANAQKNKYKMAKQHQRIANISSACLLCSSVHFFVCLFRVLHFVNVHVLLLGHISRLHKSKP